MIDKCVICGGEDDGSTIFHATGNYGSALWDDVPATDMLVIVICSGCLLAAGTAGRVTHSSTERRPPNVYSRTWNPHDKISVELTEPSKSK